MLTRTCAWCGCDLPARAGDEAEPDGISHGICDACLEIAERAMEEETP